MTIKVDKKEYIELDNIKPSDTPGFGDRAALNINEAIVDAKNNIGAAVKQGNEDRGIVYWHGVNASNPASGEIKPTYTNAYINNSGTIRQYCIYQESTSSRVCTGVGGAPGSIVAADIATDTSSFNGILSAADTDVQLALDTIDDISIPSISRGSQGEVPFMNAGGTDFDYDSTFVRDDTNNRLGVGITPLYKLHVDEGIAGIVFAAGNSGNGFSVTGLGKISRGAATLSGSTNDYLEMRNNTNTIMIGQNGTGPGAHVTIVSGSNGIQTVFDDVIMASGRVIGGTGGSRELARFIGQSRSLVVGDNGGSTSGKLHVLGDDDVVQTVIQAHSTQTSDVFDIQDSSGTSKFTVDSSYRLNIHDTYLFNNLSGISPYTTFGGLNMYGAIYASIAGATSDIFAVYQGSSSNLTLYIPGSGNVGTKGRIFVGDNPIATLTDKFKVKGTADEVQCLIQGYTTQTSDIFQIQNSGGTSQIVVDQNYYLGVGTSSPNSTLHTDGSFAVKRTASAVNVNSSNEVIIGITDTSVARTVTLQTADTVDGRIMIIKDESGAAGTNNITIATQSTQNIDGAGTATISTNYGVLRVYSDGTNWFTI